MTYTKLPDEFTDDPSVAALSDAAFRLYVSGFVYANRYLTDGFLPVAVVRMLTPRFSKKTVAELLMSSLWSPRRDGYTIADFSRHQISRDDVLALRAARAEAGRVGGLRSGERRAQRSKMAANAQATAEAIAEADAEAKPNPVPVPVPDPVTSSDLERLAVSRQPTSGEKDDDIFDIEAATVALSEIGGYPFARDTDRAMLARVRKKRPGVPLADEIAAWAERGRNGGLHDQRLALEGWLLKARDARPKKREPRCVFPGCEGRGRGAKQLCVSHQPELRAGSNGLTAELAEGEMA